METMREKVARQLLLGQADVAMHELADHADAMEARLAALERGATVAVAPKVWPVGSKPPPGVGQVRMFGKERIEILWHKRGSRFPWRCLLYGRDDGFGDNAVADAPLAEPWTEPAAIPDPRIAELEARIAALTAERDAAVKRAEEAERDYTEVWDRMKAAGINLNDAEMGS